MDAERTARDHGAAGPAGAGGPGGPGEALPLLLIVTADQLLAARLAVEAERHALDVASASDPAAVRAVLACARPDAILLDAPAGDDGARALLSELRALRPQPPVLVVAEHDTLAARVDAARRGARGFLQRSRPAAEAIEQVAQLVARTRASAPALLAVGADPALLDAVQVLLSADGFHVSVLEEPSRFRDVLERVRPDVLVLDAELPGIGGVELCRVVRADPAWAALPVLVAAVRRSAASVERVYAAGADDFLAKPVSARELRVRVRNRLERLQLHRVRSELDGLTGVANRHTATHDVERLLRLAGRHGQELAFALVDLDRFKQVNDRHGHPAGDEVLRRIGRTLRRAFRGEDVVGRWGGEEFAIGMYAMSPAHATGRLEEVLADFAREPFPGADGAPFHASFSAGVACFPADGETLGALHHAADAALYRAKADGRGCVRATGEGMVARQPETPGFPMRT